MKYKSGDILMYVNPFVFFIDKVKIEYAYKEEDGTIMYIDHTGAYLKEEELFKTWKEAQVYALELLDKFICDCRYHILNTKPTMGEEF